MRKAPGNFLLAPAYLIEKLTPWLHGLNSDQVPSTLMSKGKNYLEH